MSIYKSYRKMCPDFIVNDFVTNIIKTVPLRVGYNTIRVTLKNDKLTDKTLMYCALTALSVVCRKGCLVDIVDVVVKSGPKIDKLRVCIPISSLFAREAFFYNTILVELMNFQKDINVKVEEQFQGAPTLIAATLEEGAEALILQNSNADWSPKYEKWVGELTQEHILAILKEFSRLHALNFAFAKVNPKKVFKEFKDKLQGKPFLAVLNNKHTLTILHKILQDSLKFISDENMAKHLRSFDNELDDFLQNVLNESNDGEVLVHGDPTTSFLFSYEKNDTGNVVSKVKFIDWQLVKFGSPVLDLSLFLLTNCSGDDSNNLHQLLKQYHSYLANSLKEFQCEVNDWLSYSRLEEQWNKYAKYGLAFALLHFKLFSIEASKRPNANNEFLSSEEYLDDFVKAPNDDFVRRMKEVVKVCIANKII